MSIASMTATVKGSDGSVKLTQQGVTLDALPAFLNAAAKLVPDTGLSFTLSDIRLTPPVKRGRKPAQAAPEAQATVPGTSPAPANDAPPPARRTAR